MARAPRPARWWFVVAAVFAATVAATGAASAHASLVSTSPANGSHAEQAPRELLLHLNEPVTLVEGSAQLIDSAGARFALSAARVDDGQRRVVLVPAESVQDGAYLATARVVSADTHVVSLSIQFTVGSVTEQGQFPTDTTDSGVETYLSPASKGFAYLGLVLSAGLFLASRWAWPAAPREFRFQVVYRAGAAVLIAGLVARFVVLVAQRSGGLSEVSTAAARALLATPHGVATAVATGATLAAIALSATATRTATAVGAVQAGSAILAVTLGGHGGSAQGWPWSFAGTLLHVYAVTVWLGGVATLVLVLRGAPALRRWHLVAAGHLAVVALGGLTLAVRQVHPLDALLTTTYGLVLAGKVVGALAVVGLGHLTYRRFHRGDHGRPRTLVLESGLAVALLAATSVLTTLPPAKDVYTTDISTTLDFGAAEILHVGIDSVRRGPQRLTLRYAAPTADTPEVSVDFSSATANVARLPVRLTAADAENGELVWRSDSLIVPAPGEWKVTVRFDGRHGPKLASFHYRAL